ncbi:MAG: amidohydrolase family protein [Candidatus Bathyarchaeia archaeon]
MVDILILNGTIITMDKGRRIIHDGAVAIEKDLIVDVGSAKELNEKYKAKYVIDATKKVVMPGLFDTHAHADVLHKTVTHHEPVHDGLTDHLYRSESREALYWGGLLCALEKLKFGTTCGMAMMHRRSDDPESPSLFAKAHAEVGIRAVITVGPSVHPVRTVFPDRNKGVGFEHTVYYDDYYDIVEEVMRRWHGKAGGRIQIWACPSDDICISPIYDKLRANDISVLQEKARRWKELVKKYNSGIHSHSSAPGVIKFAHEKLGLLGPNVILAHCVGMLSEEINILKQTGTHVSHCPYAINAIGQRCPVPELIDAGVNVSLGSDAPAATTNPPFDQFMIMRGAQWLQMVYFKNPWVMPPGKLLEMVTIDGAKAFGMERYLGSIEPGKKADIILVDMFKPHLVPVWTEWNRLVFEASGHDVDTVIVDGNILMEHRVVKTVDEEKILEKAQEEGERMIEYSGVKPLMGIHEKFWGHSRY